MTDPHRDLAKKKLIDKDDYKMSELDVKQKLVEATDAVRKKFNTIKNRNMESQVALEKIYEPITKPLTQLTEANNKAKSTEIKPKTNTACCSTENKSQQAYSDEISKDSSFVDTELPYQIETPPSSITSSSGGRKIPDLVRNHIDGVKAGEPAYDTTYGIYIDGDTLMMGNAKVQFLGKTIVFQRNNKRVGSFIGNSQLYDLIFLKLPPDLSSKGHGVSDENKIIYAEMLNITNAVYKNYDAGSEYNSSKSKKYMEVIKPLLSRKMATRSMKGSGLLPNEKIYTGNQVEYVYFNEISELIDRLRLLWSSKQAGNSNLDNEILSIIAELRESGIIY